ncbi:MAG TPA: permease [Acidimicrobiia bacterium]
MNAVVAFVSAGDVGSSLREAFFMFWATLWALVLGFTLSGAVQAFVSREQMRRTLGDHGPRAVARATAFGMVSSSCSYAASAMSKSLFQKGADFVTAMVFMFASTNLVVELGIVLVVLMGWQFAAAEFVGGPIMIVLLALTGGFAINRLRADRARRRLDQSTDGRDHDHDHGAMAGATDANGRELEQASWRIKARSAAAWSDAAGYTMADVTMLRRELVIGYGVAGFLSVLVPTTWWNEIFLHGHGFWTSVENALVGPLIACISFVCSIGNVPMAAALWHGGISFGGVISFIFADLIALPLLLVYRKYYGGPIAVRLFVWFYAVMAVAGLVTEGIFHVVGAIPTSRPTVIVSEHFEWNYTTFLNIMFLAVFALLYRLHRNRAKFGAGTAYAADPECGMQVEKAHAPAHVVDHGVDVWFCSDRCRDRYQRQHARPA